MPSRTLRTRTIGLTALLAALAMVVATIGWSTSSSEAAGSHNSPGNFTGMGFDKCAAPSAHDMDRWRNAKENPYRAIGIYISGNMRGCSQQYLTRSWVSHVIATGWHLMPLTVGPQASCSGFSQRISSNSHNTYGRARYQGRVQANSAVRVARSLGISPGSTLFYDMESWHTGYSHCDASTLWFLSAWSNQLHRDGYAGGVYSSASSGIWLLGKMAQSPPRGYVSPDHIWYGQWNDEENTRTGYVGANQWDNHQRIHQFYGGHNATNGGVTMNIDSNWLDVRAHAVPRAIAGPGGNPPAPKPSPKPKPKPTPKPTPKPKPTPTPKPTPKPTPTPTPTPKPSPTTSPSPTTKAVACTDDYITRTDYPATGSGSSSDQIGALQCLLRQQDEYHATVTGTWNKATTTALHAFESKVDLPTSAAASRSVWTALLSADAGDNTLRKGDGKTTVAGKHGKQETVGNGNYVDDVLALARSLNAADQAGLHGTGYFGTLTGRAVKAYQTEVFGKSKATGIVDAKTWQALQAGKPLQKAPAGLSAPRTTSPSPTAEPSSPQPSPEPTQASQPKPRPEQQPKHQAPQGTGGHHDAALSGHGTGASRGSDSDVSTAAGIKPPTGTPKPAKPANRQRDVPNMEQPGAASTPAPVADAPMNTQAQAPHAVAPHLSAYLLNQVQEVFASLNDSMRHLDLTLFYWWL
ncbi:MAG: glycoside hydrolase domain-containing protein [Marmoricola sp.]